MKKTKRTIKNNREYNQRIASASGIFLFVFFVFSTCFSLAANKKVYYEPTVKNIISRDCSRCHSGGVRNLMDYDNLKMYATSGMLATMVQGPMAQFAGNDRGDILDWVNAGAPEKPVPAKVNFFTGIHGPGAGHCPIDQPYVTNVPMDKMTYGNTIQYVLAKDCLRCHSDRFRNLTTYDNVYIYVKSGLLKTLVQPGGPMNRFAGKDDALILAWINNGAPK